MNTSTERFFIGMDLAEGEARMVVNADMHIFPAILIAVIEIWLK